MGPVARQGDLACHGREEEEQTGAMAWEAGRKVNPLQDMQTADCHQFFSVST